MLNERTNEVGNRTKVLERLGEYFVVKQPGLLHIYRDLQTEFDANYASSVRQTVITDFFTT